MASWEEIKAACDVFGLGEEATLAEIRRIYKARIKRAHPDLGGSAAEAKRVVEAWVVLRDYCESYRFRFTKEEVRRNESPEERMKRVFREDAQWGPGEA